MELIKKNIEVRVVVNSSIELEDVALTQEEWEIVEKEGYMGFSDRTNKIMFDKFTSIVVDEIDLNEFIDEIEVSMDEY